MSHNRLFKKEQKEEVKSKDIEINERGEAGENIENELDRNKLEEEYYNSDEGYAGWEEERKRQKEQEKREENIRNLHAFAFRQ